MTSTSLNQVLGVATTAALAEGISHGTKNLLLLSFIQFSKVALIILLILLIVSFLFRKLLLSRLYTKIASALITWKEYLAAR